MTHTARAPNWSAAPAFPRDHPPKVTLVNAVEQVRDELDDIGVGDVTHQCRRITDMLVQLTADVGQFSRQWRERVAKDSTRHHG